MAAKNKPNELYISRVYDAPLKAVWEAWVDPEQVAQWWGPRGFTLTTKSKDVRPGGRWIYTMHGPDGVDYPNSTLYHEVEKYSRLVYDHGANDTQAALFRVTVEFSEVKVKGKTQTQMEMTMALATEEAAKATKKFVKKAGGDSTWDRLAEYLAKEDSGLEKFVINRAFDVSRETMFEMWTNPEHVSKWLPPIGMKMSFTNADIRVGGTSTYCMFNDDGFKMFGRTRYREIVRPERIVYEQEFIDEQGHLSRHPMLKVWPAVMITTVTLTEEAPDRTRVTVDWVAGPEATAEEIAAFADFKGSMTQGWTGSFDKLEELLETR